MFSARVDWLIVVCQSELGDTFNGYDLGEVNLPRFNSHARSVIRVSVTVSLVAWM